MNKLNEIVESGRAEFQKEFMTGDILVLHTNDLPEIETFINSFATKVHNAAIESALEALPEKAGIMLMQDGVSYDYHGAYAWDKCREEARAKVSALKEEV